MVKNDSFLSHFCGSKFAKGNESRFARRLGHFSDEKVKNCNFSQISRAILHGFARRFRDFFNFIIYFQFSRPVFVSPPVFIYYYIYNNKNRTNRAGRKSKIFALPLFKRARGKVAAVVKNFSHARETQRVSRKYFSRKRGFLFFKRLS